MYGPIEATCGATIKRLRPGEPVTIGHPNPSSRIYILDDRQQLLPRGVIGEIYISGVQVSRGYIGLPTETSRHFLNDCIRAELNKQMYRTGDQGYWNDDREIVYVGRTDRQVKLHGFRLDLGDVEAHILKAVPAATAVSAIIAGNSLLAMLQPDSLDLSTVRSLLAKSLHRSAIPQRLVAVDKIPLTGAGKIDYKAVARFAFPSQSKDAEPGMSPTETTIASLWRSILDILADVRINEMSSFSELGGDSIPALLLSHRLTATFGWAVPLKIIMEADTLAELTNAVESIRPTEASTTEFPKRTLVSQDISPVEYEWWTKYQLSWVPSCFHVSCACSLVAALDRSRLEVAWNTVLSHYKIPRCRYMQTTEGKVRRVYTRHPPRLQRRRRINVRKELNARFSLSLEHPIRVLMSQTTLLVIASHIICDLTTIKVLFNEVGPVHHGGKLEPLKKTYADSARWNCELPSTTLEFGRDI